MEKALRFEQKPKLEAVGREIVIVVCGFETGAGVQSHSAILFDTMRG
jgi:hypothetical protein